mgnify:CR=1 FL=1
MDSAYKLAIQIAADVKDFNKKVSGAKGMLKKVAAVAGVAFGAMAIKEAATAVFNYGKEVDTVRNKIKQLSGLQGAALNNMTGSVMATSKVFQKDYNQVLSAANALTKQLGASHSGAMDLIKQGLASGADVNGDFLDQIREYSVQFKEAGLNAEQTIAIMSQGVKSGIWSDKGADVIKEGTIRLREMTQGTKDALEGIGISSDEMKRKLETGQMTIFQAIQKVSGKLKEMPPQSAEVGTAIADIFGGPGEDAGLQFLTTLEDINLEMDDVVAESGEMAASQLRLVEAQERLKTLSAAVFGGMNDGVRNLKASVLELVAKAIESFARWYNEYVDLYNQSAKFRGMIDTVRAHFQTLWEIVKGFFNAAIGGFKVIGQVIQAQVTGNFHQIPFIIRKSIKEGLPGAVDDIKQFGKDAAERYREAWDDEFTEKKKIDMLAFQDVKEPAKEKAEETGQAIGEALMRGMQKGMSKKQGKGPETVDFKTGAIDTSQLKDLAGAAERTAQAFAGLKNEQKNFMQQFEQAEAYFEDAKGGFSVFEKSITAATRSMIEFSQQGANSLKEYRNSVLNIVRDVIKAQIAEGVAGAVKSALSSVPFPFNFAAAALAAGTATTLFNMLIPKFAQGALISGPTVGMVGEYPGANSNPEVIAPLSKLKNMIGGGDFSGEVIFRIGDRELVGVLQRSNRIIKNTR